MSKSGRRVKRRFESEGGFGLSLMKIVVPGELRATTKSFSRTVGGSCTLSEKTKPSGTRQRRSVPAHSRHTSSTEKAPALYTVSAFGPME